MVLEHGADCARVNGRGQTGLAAGTFHRHGPIVRIFLVAGADPGAGQRSAVQIAQFLALPDMVALVNNSPQASEAGKYLDVKRVAETTIGHEAGLHNPTSGDLPADAPHPQRGSIGAPSWRRFPPQYAVIRGRRRADTDARMKRICTVGFAAMLVGVSACSSPDITAQTSKGPSTTNAAVSCCRPPLVRRRRSSAADLRKSSGTSRNITSCCRRTSYLTTRF
jgi:hypothetical protein